MARSVGLCFAGRGGHVCAPRPPQLTTDDECRAAWACGPDPEAPTTRPGLPGEPTSMTAAEPFFIFLFFFYNLRRSVRGLLQSRAPRAPARPQTMADELDIPLSFEALLDGSAEGAHADEAARCAQRLATATKVRVFVYGCFTPRNPLHASANTRRPPRPFCVQVPPTASP